MHFEVKELLHTFFFFWQITQHFYIKCVACKRFKTKPMRRQLLKQKSVIQQILLKARGYRNSLEFIHLLKIYQIVDSLGQIPSVRLSEGFCINANWIGDQYCSEEVSPECQGFEDNAIQITLLPIMLTRLVKKCLIWSYTHQKSCTLLVMKFLFFQYILPNGNCFPWIVIKIGSILIKIPTSKLYIRQQTCTNSNIN